jgi:hypothetical protein
MTLYQSLLIAHVLGVILWLGGSVTNTLLLARARSSAAPERLRLQVENTRWLDLRMGMPASLVVLLAGGWLMTEGGWPFDTAIWIHIGMGALLAAVAIGMFWTARYQRKLLAVHEGSSMLEALVGKILLGNAASILLILVGLWAMIAKPTVG